MRLQRLLFASVHAYPDPSGGASAATRDLLEPLADAGVDCRALTCGVYDHAGEVRPGDVLGRMGVPHAVAGAALGRGGEAEVLDFALGGVRATLLPTASSRPERAPNRAEAADYLDLADQALARFAPQVLLTYGGHPANLELMRRARIRGVAVVFHAHNFGYPDRSAFADTSAILVPSDYARRWYARHAGVAAMAIPPPLRRDRVVAGDPEPTYLTFVNPQPAKGSAVVARIALELGRRRPELPLLVVEGRGGADALAAVGLDLSGLGNLHRMANTPDPRDFWRVSRAVLVPSLWRESFGRVAAEGLANGLPVLASDRGALPETLGDAGFAFALPPRCTPAGGVPTAREVAPWVATVERLWDDPGWERAQRERARAEAPRWDFATSIGRHRDFFGALIRRGDGP